MNLRSDEFLCEAMQTCGDAVYRLAFCRLENKADAEDVYQEVFLRLLRDTTEFEDGEHLKAWLIRVTLSRCTDMRRSAWYKHTAPLEAAPDASAPETEDYSTLWQAVHALPDDLRIAVYLHYVEGYSTDEIAAIVGCRPVTVRTRLHRARKHLKLDLEGINDEEHERTVQFAEHESTVRAETADTASCARYAP